MNNQPQMATKLMEHYAELAKVAHPLSVSDPSEAADEATVWAMIAEVEQLKRMADAQERQAAALERIAAALEPQKVAAELAESVFVCGAGD